MLLYLIAYLGGALTIISPCILPVLPFVFARADRPFLSNGLPMLAGMAVMFAAVATLASLGGGWAVQANRYGRGAALLVLVLFGLALLVPGFAERLSRPLVGLGSRLSQRLEAGRSGPWSSLALGMATGLLWAPCAGPILGVVLTGAALRGAGVGTSLLLLVYAAGAATSLAMALLIGGRLLRVMKRSLGVGEWLRRAAGAGVLAAAVAIACGVDTGLLSRASVAGTHGVEQSLLDRLPGSAQRTAQGSGLPDLGPMPALDGAVAWLNSPPLTAQALRGKVVLVDFWTYSCINCLRTLPHVKAWADRYGKDGLVVIGVHAPEFAFEKDIANVRAATVRLGITYPVAIDDDYAIWRGFDNRYWPAQYVIDAQGRVRHQHFGEGDEEESERVIRALLAEAHGGTPVPPGQVAVRGEGVQADSSEDVQSDETYIGYARTEGSVSRPGIAQDRPATYQTVPQGLNQWGLAGAWTVGPEHATLDASGGGILYRFHARDLNLVLGPHIAGQPIRFRLTIDGHPPGDDRGADTDPAGAGTIDTQRLYQLVRLKGPVADHDFAIRFLSPGVEAFSFTFG